jgi:hypothetical protein
MSPEERMAAIETLERRANSVRNLQAQLDQLKKCLPFPERCEAVFRPLVNVNPYTIRPEGGPAGYLDDRLLRKVLERGITLMSEQLEAAIEVTLKGSEILSDELGENKPLTPESGS